MQCVNRKVIKGMKQPGKTKVSEAAKEARRAYDREWARTHKEMRAAARKRYWEKKAQEGNTNNGKEASNE